MSTLKLRAINRFPSNVTGSGGITVVKDSGEWVISLDSAFLSSTISAIIASAGLGNIRIVTAAGDVTVVSGDSVLLMNKTVGASTNIFLPTSALRAGFPIIVKDYRGDANTNNITFVPNGVETIDGFSTAAAAMNGTALINVNYGKKTLYPLVSGGWYL